MGQRRLRAEKRSKKNLVRKKRGRSVAQRGRMGRGGDQVRGEKREFRQ